MITGIQKKNHPTVWREMQRWHNNGWLAQVDTELNDLFIANPEALGCFKRQGRCASIFNGNFLNLGVML